MAKVKTKKCALRSCGKEFKPKLYWQKYHSPRCRLTAANKKMLALIRRGKKSLAAEEQKAS